MRGVYSYWAPGSVSGLRGRGKRSAVSILIDNDLQHQAPYSTCGRERKDPEKWGMIKTSVHEPA